MYDFVYSQSQQIPYHCIFYDMLTDCSFSVNILCLGRGCLDTYIDHSVLEWSFLIFVKIETEGPVYVGIVRDYLKDFWDTWWPVVYKYLAIVWDFLSENVPVLLAKTQELLTKLAYKIYELAPDFFSSLASWLAKLGQKIAEKFPDVIAVIQEYAVIAGNLAINIINAAVEWLQNIAGR